MGAEESIPLPPPPPGFEYFVISLSDTDRIRVLFGSQHELSIIRQAIMEYWGLGIQQEEIVCGYSYSFKLKGWPFGVAAHAVQAAGVRHLVSQILQRINNAGWELLFASDLSRGGDMATFFFVNKSAQQVKQIQYPMLCIGFSSTDKLQILNAPANVIGAIKNVIQASWGRGIQAEGPKENCYEFKLLGNPWFSYGDESVHARILLNNLLTTLGQHQLVLHGAANIKSTADTLFFKYDPTAGQVSPHFVISLNGTDRLRMINAPEAVVQIVRQIIAQYWSTRGGIQEERMYSGCWEFKLKGNPWWASDGESVMTRFLMCKILEGLQSAGWHIKSAIDISRSGRDKSVLVFYQAQPLNAPVMCLSFNDSDKIRLVNTPEEFIGILRGVIQTHWRKGIQEELQFQCECMAHQFKLIGNPWANFSVLCVEGLHIRSLLCYVLQAISQRGWRMLTSADVSAKYISQKNGPDYPIDVHSWWFTYDTSGLQPAAPAYGFAPTQFTAPASTGTGLGQTQPFNYEPTSVPSFAPPSYDQALSGGQAPK